MEEWKDGIPGSIRSSAVQRDQVTLDLTLVELSHTPLRTLMNGLIVSHNALGQ